MITYRDFIRGFQELGLNSESKVLVHASLPSLGGVSGGVETVVGALLATAHVVVTPTFTTTAMIIPPFGPEDNAIQYRSMEENEHVIELDEEVRLKAYKAVNNMLKY